MVYETMLKGELCCGVSCDFCAELSGFHESIINAILSQLVCAQNTY